MVHVPMVNVPSLLTFSGVHFLTGHVFDMEAITKAAHSKVCIKI